MTRPASGAPWPTASTRLVALLGWPARHSLSPDIHNAAFAEQGLDLVYVVAETPPEELAGTIRALGAMGARGANVTVPHKQAAMAACDHLTDEAQLVGAVNTLVWTAEGLLGDNTDAVGLADDLRAERVVATGDELVVLGTGGAARAVAVAAGRLGVRLVAIGRRRDAARELAELARRAGAPAAGEVALDDVAAVASAVAAARLVVNATPLGMHAERLPDPFHALRADQTAYDLVYEPAETPFLVSARQRGARTHHGLAMLVGQAAVSYRRWTGRPAPVGTMSAVATAALSERLRHP